MVQLPPEAARSFAVGNRRFAAARHGAEDCRDQTIVSNPKQAERGTQMIWRPVPQIKPQPEIASPNILAFRLPVIRAAPARTATETVCPSGAQAEEAARARARLPEPPKVAKRDQARIRRLSANLVAALENRPKPRNFVPPVPRPERPRGGSGAAGSSGHRNHAAVGTCSVAGGEHGRRRSPINRSRAPLFRRRRACALRPGPWRCRMRRRSRATRARERWGAERWRCRMLTAAALANKPKPRDFVPPAALAGGGPA